MKLAAGRLALALGGATAILWLSCSLLLATFSGPMMSWGGHMFHMGATGHAFTMTAAGFFVGLISWSLMAAAAGGLIAWIYNATGSTR